MSETAGGNNAKNRKRLRQIEKIDGDAIVVFVQVDDKQKRRRNLKVKLFVL